MFSPRRSLSVTTRRLFCPDSCSRRASKTPFKTPLPAGCVGSPRRLVRHHHACVASNGRPPPGQPGPCPGLHPHSCPALTHRGIRRQRAAALPPRVERHAPGHHLEIRKTVYRRLPAGLNPTHHAAPGRDRFVRRGVLSKSPGFKSLSHRRGGSKHAVCCLRLSRATRLPVVGTGLLFFFLRRRG